jgi:hypothetical protein
LIKSIERPDREIPPRLAAVPLGGWPDEISSAILHIAPVASTRPARRFFSFRPGDSCRSPEGKVVVLEDDD